MIKLEKLSIDEINSKPFLINQIFDLYGDVSGEFYSYKYKNEDRWLYRDVFYFTILGIEGEYIIYTSFMIDENYDLSYMEFDEFAVAKNNNGEKFLYREGSFIAESLIMQKRLKSTDEDYLDGLITHHQVNSVSGNELLISYKTLYRENPEYYSSLFYNPFIFSFINDGKIEQYLQFVADSNYWSYDLITIKEFGLMKFLQNGAYDLQNSKCLTRYFKIKGQKSDGSCILLYPFSKSYTEEDMKKMLEKRGFARSINNYVLDYYNGVYLESAEYNELALAIQEYDNLHRDEMKLEKVPGDKNADN